MSRLVLVHIGELVSVSGRAPRCGKEMDNLAVIRDGCVVIDDGIIRWVGTMGAYVNEKEHGDGPDTDVIDCTGKAVVPGFVDSHTHFVFGGYREKEYAMRMAGRSYMDIMNAGGGIVSSVSDTRRASYDALMASGGKRLDRMLAMGVTTVEGKSGYGLDMDTELKQLKVMKALNESHPVDVIATYLGPHAVPTEELMQASGLFSVHDSRWKDKDFRRKAYLDKVIEAILPKVCKEQLAAFADIFCEEGVYEVEDSRRYLKRAKELGLKLKIHADEMVPLGGAMLAARMNAVSADHLLAASDESIESMAVSGTIATLLPGTAFSLRENYADARKIIDKGAAVALATDFNPGSCPTQSIPLIIALAAVKMGMTTREILSALTINGACAVGLSDRIGSIEAGKDGDLLILEYPSIDFLPYHLGMNIIEKVIKKGKVYERL